MSPSGGGPRSPAVVIVTAGIPRASTGPCSNSEYGNARVTSCCHAGARAGGRPVCSAIRADAVWTSESAGERAVFAAIWSRGGPLPAIASRSTSAKAPCRYGEEAANWLAPIPPNEPPSVERKTSVCAGRTGAGEDGLASGVCAYDRASSISAAVPDALSFAPAPTPRLSRCAAMTISSCDWPGTIVTRFWSSCVPRPGIVARKRSTSVVSPYGASCALYQSAAAAAPGEPGERSG